MTINQQAEYPASFYYDSNAHVQYGHWDIPLVREVLARAECIVEIGAYLGHSSVAFAKLSSDLARIICIDPWDPAELHCSGFQRVSRHDTYLQFISNCVHNGVALKIEPIRMDSISYSKIFTEKYDLLYIDGDHSEEAVYQDLKHWFPKKADKGLVCGDDWTLFNDWKGHNTQEFNYPTELTHTIQFVDDDQLYMVRRGVKRFAQEQGVKTIKSFGRFWWFDI